MTRVTFVSGSELPVTLSKPMYAPTVPGMLLVVASRRKSNAVDLADRSKVSVTPAAVPPVSVFDRLPLLVTTKVSAAVPPVRLSNPLKFTVPVGELERFPALAALIVQFVTEFGPMRISVIVEMLPLMKLSKPLMPPVEVAVLVCRLIVLAVVFAAKFRVSSPAPPCKRPVSLPAFAKTN